MINYSIIGNNKERRVGIGVALLLAILWFTDIKFIDGLPRFFLAGLLLAVALPFLDKSLFKTFWQEP